MSTTTTREELMTVLARDENGKPSIWCDPEIADLVGAINAGGIETVSSCSGHGHRPGYIALTDGRWLIVANDEERKIIDAAFPVDVNGVSKQGKENRASDERLTLIAHGIAVRLEAGASGAPDLDRDIASAITELLSLRSKPVAGVEVKPLIDWLRKRGEPDSGIRYEGATSNEFARRPARVELHGADADFVAKHFHGAGARALADILSTLSLPAQEPAGALPSKFRMDGDAAKAISFMLGSSDEEDDTWSDALLWVGNLEDDDGAQVYGLHLANAEYPEEGGITLATFDPQPAAVITEKMVEQAAKAMFNNGSVVSWETALDLIKADPSTSYGSIVGSFRIHARTALTAALKEA